MTEFRNEPGSVVPLRTQIAVRRLTEGAKQAEGLVIVIDVFRAFSLEC